MKSWAWGAIAVVSTALVACAGGGSSTTAGTGGSSTSSSGSGTTSTGTGTGTGGTGTGTGTGGSAPACGTLVYSQEPACQGCMETACCIELEDCDTGTACDALVKCADQCAANDQTCVQQCVAQNGQDALTAAQALFNCADQSCKMECTPPGICGSNYNVPNNTACTTCLDMSCCTQWDACLQDMTGACETCLTMPSGMGCDTNMLYQDVVTCRTGTCGNDCGAPICNSGWVLSGNAACANCLSMNCCAEYTACGPNNMACSACLTAATPGPDCATNAEYQAVTACDMSKCAMECN